MKYKGINGKIYDINCINLIQFNKGIIFASNEHLLNDLHELKNKTIGCWCKHGDVLSEFQLKKIINFYNGVYYKYKNNQ